MIKTAQIKEAEVRGVLAAMVDNGYVEVASTEAFDKFASDVNALVPDNYDMDTVIAAADAVLDGGYEKTAELAGGDAALQLAMGELALMKVAGQISDDDYDEAVAGIIKAAAIPHVDNGLKWDPKKGLILTDKDKKAMMKTIKAQEKKSNKAVRDIAKTEGKSVAAVKEELNKNIKVIKPNKLPLGKKIGLGIAGTALAGGAALGGKALYDKYSK